MSLNKLSLSTQKGLDLDLKIGCVELKVNEVKFEGLDGDSGDVLTTDGNGSLSLSPVKKISTFGLIRNTNTSQGPFIVPSGGGTMYITTDTSVASQILLPPEFYSLTPTGLQILQSGKYRVEVFADFSINSVNDLYVNTQCSINGDTSFQQKLSKTTFFHKGTLPAPQQSPFRSSLIEILDANENDTLAFGIFNQDTSNISVNPNVWFIAIERVAD